MLLARLAPAIVVLSAWSPPAPAYSVLSHEAIIDSAWDQDLQPLLKKRFPRATADDLRKAHAYAYGGCIIQDMGYYPFGSKFFSDLVHYVRSGDFVEALFQQAHSLEEYAFALGALAHYNADINGHSVAVNRAVPIEYPKLKKKYGESVTYAENPGAHIKTEFGFDVLQVARGRYAPQAYHDFIGFEVAHDALDRAFFQVYALHLKDIFTFEGLAFGSYRHAVSHTIPTATRVAWQLKKTEIAQDQPGMTRRRFLYNIRRASYEKEWGHDYRKPGIGARVLAAFVSVIPKIGPFRALAFRPPTGETARMFEASFNRTLDRYRATVREAAAGTLHLADINLDTGGPVLAGKYSLADRAYATLTEKLAERDFSDVPDATRRNILEFYSQGSAAVTQNKQKENRDKLRAALNKLKASQ